MVSFDHPNLVLRFQGSIARYQPSLARGLLSSPPKRNHPDKRPQSSTRRLLNEGN